LIFIFAVVQKSWIDSIFYQFSKVPLVFIDYLINDTSFMFDFSHQTISLEKVPIYFSQKMNTGFSKFWGFPPKSENWSLFRSEIIAC